MKNKISDTIPDPNKIYGDEDYILGRKRFKLQINENSSEFLLRAKIKDLEREIFKKNRRNENKNFKS